MRSNFSIRNNLTIGSFKTYNNCIIGEHRKADFKQQAVLLFTSHKFLKCYTKEKEPFSSLGKSLISRRL